MKNSRRCRNINSEWILNSRDVQHFNHTAWFEWRLAGEIILCRVENNARISCYCNFWKTFQYFSRVPTMSILLSPRFQQLYIFRVCLSLLFSGWLFFVFNSSFLRAAASLFILTTVNCSSNQLIFLSMLPLLTAQVFCISLLARIFSEKVLNAVLLKFPFSCWFRIEIAFFRSYDSDFVICLYT